MEDIMPSPMPQAYKHWLMDDGAPPVQFRAASWLRTGRCLMARMRQVRQALLEPDASWETFEEWLELRQDLDALDSWGGVIGPRSGPVGEYPRIAARLSQAFHRLRRSSARHGALHVLRGWLRRTKNPLTAAQKSAVTREIDDWGHAKQYAAALTPQERLGKGFLRREANFNAHCERTPVFLNRRQAMTLPGDIRRTLRANARAMGARGWCVPAHSDEARECLRYVHDADIRETLWRQRQNFLIDDPAVARMLCERQTEAKGLGFKTYASMAAASTALPKPRKIVGLLKDATRLAMNTLKGQGMAKTILPWDVAYEFEQRAKTPVKEPAGAFPVGPTIERVVADLLPVGGWNPVYTTIHAVGEDKIWQFQAVNAEGRCLELWIAPYASRDSGLVSSNEAGAALHIRQRRSAVGQLGPASDVVAITMPTPRTVSHFSRDTLATLAHELGHALHYLAMDTGDYTGIVDFPFDAGEFPSQLVEQVTSDPAWLASMASSAEGRKVAAWKAVLNQDLVGVLYWFRRLMHMQLDLECHLLPARDSMAFLTLARRVYASYGVPLHEDDMTPISTFRSDGLGALDYCYPLSMALAEHFVPTRADGTVDAEGIKACFSDLYQGLLTESTDIKKFRKSWKRHTGMTIDEGVSYGFRAWARRTLRHPAPTS
jgi:hypothetical protein